MARATEFETPDLARYILLLRLPLWPIPLKATPNQPMCEEKDG